MKSSSVARVGLIVAVALLVQIAGAQPATAPIEPSGKPAAPIQLFNGKDLDGWTWVPRPPRPATTGSTAPAQPASPPTRDEVWTLADGVLRSRQGPVGYLRTERAYSNYLLTIECRHLTRGNGGFLVGITGPDKIWPRCLEIQGASDQMGDFWNMGELKLTAPPDRVRGRRVVKMATSSEKPMGEWDTVEILVDHGRVSVTVNGTLQNIATDVEDLTGAIGIQAEGASMEFRKIELRPIEP